MTRRALRAGVFAAGVGGRLHAPNRRPKGLTPIGGRPLVDWILDDLDAAGVCETVIIINDDSTVLRDHVRHSRPDAAVRWIVETTPSSMHSFLRVVETLAADGDQGPFLISTVDTVAPPGTFRQFVELAAGDATDLILALTARIEDESPLRVELRPDHSSRIAALDRGMYATAGYSLVRPTVLAEAAAARQANLSGLRHFFKHLFDTGYRLSGIVMPDSIDVDRPEDIEAAEWLLLLRARATDD